jgi:ABC-type glycerol-3-phosphate transport system substrate-binding protein
VLKRRAWMTALATAIVVSACSATAPTPPPTPAPSYSGFVSLGSTLRAFGPCDQAEQWWIVDRPQELADQYQVAATGANDPVYVVIEGNVDATQHGPAGTFNRELRITRLVSMDSARQHC